MRAAEAPRTFVPAATDLEELVACGLSPKAATQLLANLGSLRSIGSATIAELRAAGVPPTTAARVAAAIAIGRRIADVGRDRIDVPTDVWRILRPRIVGLEQELFFVILLDIRLGLIHVDEIARGTVHGVEVHPREVFRSAIRHAAAGLILAHNHPSGDLTPSPEDLALTTRLFRVGKLLGIPVMDHTVVTATGYRSLQEHHPDVFTEEDGS